MNHKYIVGWHFRNFDNSGPNEVGPKNVNAPGKVREFYFVLNDTDYKKYSDALDKILYSYSYSKKEIEEARNVWVKTGKGKLTIKEMKLNNLVVGQRAGIDHMSFNVEFNLSSEWFESGSKQAPLLAQR